MQPMKKGYKNGNVPLLTSLTPTSSAGARQCAQQTFQVNWLGSGVFYVIVYNSNSNGNGNGNGNGNNYS